MIGVNSAFTQLLDIRNCTMHRSPRIVHSSVRKRVVLFSIESGVLLC